MWIFSWYFFCCIPGLWQGFSDWLNISKSPVGCSASTSKPSSRGPASAIVMRNQEIESSVGAAQEASSDGEGHAKYMHVYDMIWYDMIIIMIMIMMMTCLWYDMIWCDYDYDYGFDYDMIYDMIWLWLWFWLWHALRGRLNIEWWSMSVYYISLLHFLIYNLYVRLIARQRRVCCTPLSLHWQSAHQEDAGEDQARGFRAGAKLCCSKDDVSFWVWFTADLLAVSIYSFPGVLLYCIVLFCIVLYCIVV